MRQDEFNEVKVTNEGQSFKYEFTNAQKTEFSFQSENSYKSVSDEKREETHNEDRINDRPKVEVKNEDNSERLKEETMNSGDSSSSSSSSSGSSSSSSSSSSSTSSSSSALSSASAASTSAVSSTVATAASVVAVSAVAVATGVSVIQNQNASCTFQELNVFSDRVEYALVLENNDTEDFNISVTSDLYAASKKLASGVNTGEFVGLEGGTEYRILVQEDGTSGQTLYDQVFTTNEAKKEEEEQEEDQPTYNSEVSAFNLFNDINYSTYSFRMRITYTDEANIFSDFELYLKDMEDENVSEHVFNLEKTGDMQYISLLVDNQIVVNPDHRLKYEFSYFDNSKNERVVYKTNENFRFQESVARVYKYSINSKAAITDSTFTVNTMIDNDGSLSDFELYIEDLTLKGYKEEMPEEMQFDYKHTFTFDISNGIQTIKFLDEEAGYEFSPEDVFKYELSYKSHGQKVVHASSDNFSFDNTAFRDFYIKPTLSSDWEMTYTLDYEGAASQIDSLTLAFYDPDTNEPISGLDAISLNIGEAETELKYGFKYYSAEAQQILISQTLVPHLVGGIYYEDGSAERIDITGDPVTLVKESNQIITGLTSENDFAISENYTIELTVIGEDPEEEYTGELEMVFTNVTNPDITFNLPFTREDLGESIEYDITRFGFSINQLTSSGFTVMFMHNSQKIFELPDPVLFEYSGPTEPSIGDFVSTNHSNTFEVTDDNYFYGYLVDISDPLEKINGLTLNLKDVSQSDINGQEFSFALDLNESEQYFNLNEIELDGDYDIFDYISSDSFELSVVDTVNGQIYVGPKTVTFDYQPDVEDSLSLEIDENCLISEDLSFSAKLNVSNDGETYSDLIIRFTRSSDDKTFDVYVEEADWNEEATFYFRDEDATLDDFVDEQFDVTVIDGNTTEIYWPYQGESAYFVTFKAEETTDEDFINFEMAQSYPIGSDLTFVGRLNIENNQGTYPSNLTIRLIRHRDGYPFNIDIDQTYWNEEKDYVFPDTAELSEIANEEFDLQIVDRENYENIYWSYYEYKQSYIMFTNNDPVTPSSDYINGFANEQFIVNESEGQYLLNIELDILNDNDPPTYEELTVTFTPITSTQQQQYTAFTVNIPSANSSSQSLDLTDAYNTYGDALFNLEFDWTISGFEYDGADYQTNSSIKSSQNPIHFVDGSSSQGSDSSGTYDDSIEPFTRIINSEGMMEVTLHYTEEGDDPYFTYFRMVLLPQDGTGLEYQIDLDKTTEPQLIDMYDDFYVPDACSSQYGTTAFNIEIRACTPDHQEVQEVLYSTSSPFNFIIEGQSQSEPVFSSYSVDTNIDTYNRISVTLYFDGYGDEDYFIMTITDETAQTSTVEFPIIIEHPVYGENTIDLSAYMTDDDINNILLDESRTFTITLRSYVNGSQEGEPVGETFTNQSFTKSN